jgi:hypothetical protein
MRTVFIVFLLSMFIAPVSYADIYKYDENDVSVTPIHLLTKRQTGFRKRMLLPFPGKIRYSGKIPETPETITKSSMKRHQTTT